MNQFTRYVFIKPLAAISPTSAQRVFAEQFIPLILSECSKQGVFDPAQIAYILATAQHESLYGDDPYNGVNYNDSSLEGKLVEKSGYKPGSQADRDYFNYLEGRQDLENTQPGDGYKYRGRGFSQLTGRGLYSGFGVYEAQQQQCVNQFLR